MSIPTTHRSLSFLLALLLIIPVYGRTYARAGNALAQSDYYIDSSDGNDDADGLTPETAWRSLSKISGLALQPGDRILLKRGSIFSRQGFDMTNQNASAEDPIIINAYGEGNVPVIDMEDMTRHAVILTRCGGLEIMNIEMTGGSGGIFYNWLSEDIDYDHLVFRNLYIHDCYKSNGSAFHLNLIPNGEVRKGDLTNVLIEDCRVEMVVRSFINAESLNNATVRNNSFYHSGGPGIRIGKSDNLLISGNSVYSSGSLAHSSFNGRGSCGWIILCKNVLVEKNIFENAHGWLDSYGFHLDIGNKNVIVQYNLSKNNAGGFVQILGKNKNTCYRYNVSIDDGWRVKGVYDHPEEKNIQDGCVISLNGYVANGTFEGPYDTYIYNNTVYVNENIQACFNFRYTIDGAFIANNIFQFLGSSKNITGGLNDREPDVLPVDVVFINNLYLNAGNLPTGMLIDDTGKLFGDVGFVNPGGQISEDYIPTNTDIFQDLSIPVTNIPNDPLGLHLGFEVAEDILGNPIVGIPDLGAIESSLTSFPYANAGRDVEIDYYPVDSVVFEGEGIDDIEITGYHWKQISGGNCTLKDTLAKNLVILNPEEGEFTFRLTVTDNDGNTDSDDIELHIYCKSCHTPVVNAGGDRTVQLPVDTIKLSGNASVELGTIASYLWELNSGPSADLTGTETPVLTLSNLTDGTYSFTFKATSDAGHSASSQVSVEVLPAPDSIRKNTNSIIIDGVLDEAWCCDSLKLEKLVQGYLDENAYVRLMWDENFLYVFATVIDEYLMNDSGDEWWNDDIIEIFLDPDRSGGNTVRQGDLHLGFRWHWVASEMDVSEKNFGSTEGIDWNLVENDHGYQLECRIPWMLSAYTPEEGGIIAVEVRAVWDDDGGVRDAARALFGFDGAIDLQPAYFGKMILGRACPKITAYTAIESSSCKIYPSPSRGSITIELPDNETHEYKLIDSAGRLLMHGNILNGDRLNLAPLPDGIYQIIIPGVKTGSRIILQKP